MSSATAANNVTNWMGTTFLLTLLGGFLGDSYWGRFWTCVVFQGVHLLGLVLLSLTVTLDNLKPPSCTASGITVCPKPSGATVNMFFIAIYIIALGTGGYLPAFLTMGADQLDSAKQRTTFFGWLFFCTNVGTVLANTVFVYVENQGNWALGYWLATGVGGMAVLMFCIGVPTYRHYKPGGNPFTRVARVVVAMLRKWRVKVPEDENKLHEWSDKELVAQGSRKMVHTKNLRCLDKAATIVGSPNELQDAWRLCSVTQVEEVKCICLMIPVWLCVILFSVAFSQVNTFFIEQAAVMDTKVGRFHIPPASTSLFNVASILAVTMVYPSVVAPMAKAVTGNPEGLTQFQRMGLGQIGTALAMVLAALVESWRLRLLHSSHHRLSVFWLVPQNVVLGVGQVFGYVGGTDFFYSQAPHAMRGLVSSFPLAILSIGCFTSSVLVSLVVQFTKRDGHEGWIPPNLDHGHLDYFYWLVFAIILLNIALFSVVAQWYHSKTSLPKVISPSDVPLLPNTRIPQPFPHTHSQPLQV